MYKRIECHFTKLHQTQFGFLRGRSCSDVVSGFRRMLRRSLNTVQRTTVEEISRWKPQNTSGDKRNLRTLAVFLDCTDAYCKVPIASSIKSLVTLGLPHIVIRAIAD